MMDNDKKYCVYKHTSPNGKVYIGITSNRNPNRRWKNGNGYKSNSYFYSAIEKYGWDNFEHEILENDLTLTEAYAKETYYIDRFQSNDPEYGYNLTAGGDGIRDYVFSEEIKKKLSDLKRGEGNSFYGKHHSEETKKILSEKSKEHQQKYGNPRKGVKVSDEQLLQMINSATGRTVSEETRKKMSDARRGKRQNITKRSKNKGTSKRVYCPELERYFDSMTECAKYFNVTATCICNHIRDNSKYHEYTLLYADDNTERYDYPILQIDIHTCKILNRYENAQEASDVLQVPKRGIIEAADHKRISSAGYFWVYEKTITDLKEKAKEIENEKIWKKKRSKS